jgi:RimJ/RimL family protein N-acetyltransferase
MSREIVTPRLRLREARMEDLEAMHAVLGDPRATLYWSTPPHAELEETRAWLTSMIAAPEEQRFDFIIEHEGRCVGKCGMYQIPEIGFILHPDLWGRGLAAEALGAVVREAFKSLAIPAIEADVDPRNTRSLKLLQRLGFRITGRAERTWYISGQWHDSLYLTLPRSAVDENAAASSGASPSA